ncbi:hypothetical protein L915_17003 [Phytophthora nicotianae]|uniref:Ubiquitin-like protease family profile domain-containing protein n=3 Tax=Phytophthora nicotianae TaxID=4792 RepID=V9EBH8_PHYNI|nr:hypothetical protein F443_17473 [Phytophthora nicotianae P1569]ETK76632.1 hypothetical protein L915_17003 [Phytophthora nicotianae]ETL30069.1 hypothetical protein L916_16900 [Phytophthora nicotianae]
MENVVNKYFGEHVSGLEKIRQRAPQQEDMHSCGPLTLLFFESQHPSAKRFAGDHSVSALSIPISNQQMRFLSEASQYHLKR